MLRVSMIFILSFLTLGISACRTLDGKAALKSQQFRPDLSNFKICDEKKEKFPLQNKCLSLLYKGDDFEAQKAIIFGYLSKATYLNSSSDKFDDLTLALDGGNFSRVLYFERNGFEGLIFIHPRFMVVSFQGTTTLQDWWADASWAIVEMSGVTGHQGFLGAVNGNSKNSSPDGNYPLKLLELNLKSKNRNKDRLKDAKPVEIENNSVADMSIREMITKIYQQETSKSESSNGGPIDLWLTGHSLGGALALVTSLPYQSVLPVKGVYSFGAPRAFSETTVRMLQNSGFKNIHRMTTEGDIVPQLPKLKTGLRHFGIEHRLIKTQNNNYCTMTTQNLEDLAFELESLPKDISIIQALTSEAGITPHYIKNYLNCLEDIFVSQFL